MEGGRTELCSGQHRRQQDKGTLPCNVGTHDTSLSQCGCGVLCSVHFGNPPIAIQSLPPPDLQSVCSISARKVAAPRRWLLFVCCCVSLRAFVGRSFAQNAAVCAPHTVWLCHTMVVSSTGLCAAVCCCVFCRAFVGRSFAKSVDEAKYSFFSDDLPQEDAIKWVGRSCWWGWVALPWVASPGQCQHAVVFTLAAALPCLRLPSPQTASARTAPRGASGVAWGCEIQLALPQVVRPQPLSTCSGADAVG